MSSMTPKQRKDRAKNLRLQKKYKITLKDYQRMLKEQNYRCAVCGKKNSDCKWGLVVDHLHAPPQTVRGLLCPYCNRYIVGRCSDYYRMAGLVKYVTKQLKTDKAWKKWCDSKRAKRKDK